MNFFWGILIFTSTALATLHFVSSQMEMLSLRPNAADELFTCPDKSDIVPCDCHSVLIPTIHCNGIPTRTLKTIHRALGELLLDVPIPYLKVNSFGIVGLPSRAFGNITATRLQLSHTKLTYVAPDAFQGMDSLLLLSLQNSGLREIPSESFAHLPYLVTLSLTDNKISRLIRKDFIHLTGIRHFAVSNNRISDIERGTFPMGLVTLSLSNNHLLTLNRTVRNLPFLQWLFLSDNRLTSIDGELEGLYDLKILTLGNNLLRNLADSFHDLYSLDTLELQYNNIYELGDSLKYLSNLQWLNLSNNIFFELDESAFQGMTSLQKLDLSGNYIMTLGNILAPLTRLISLNLSKNYLNVFSIAEISGLNNLRVLDLSRNNILAARSSSNHTEVRRLRVLFLQKNEINDLGEFLSHLPALEDLDVSYNNVSRLRSRSFANSTRLVSINVEGNPLICDIQQVHVFHELENNKVEIAGMPNCSVDPNAL